METRRADAAANAAVNGADLVLPDGIGIVYGAKILHEPLKEAACPGIEFGTGTIERCAWKPRQRAFTCSAQSRASPSRRRKTSKTAFPAL